MRTNQQPNGPAGNSQFQWTDTSGVLWDVVAEWSIIGGRAECTALTMDSHGNGRMTSTVVRQVEAEVRRRRQVKADSLHKLANVKGMPNVARRAARQAPAFSPDATARPATPGRPRDDDAWHNRAIAMRNAWEQGIPMIEALRQLDPVVSRDTLRKQIDRTRAWDREHGPGILQGVGRPRQQNPQPPA